MWYVANTKVSSSSASLILEPESVLKSEILYVIQKMGFLKGLFGDGEGGLFRLFQASQVERSQRGWQLRAAAQP